MLKCIIIIITAEEKAEISAIDFYFVVVVQMGVTFLLGASELLFH